MTLNLPDQEICEKYLAGMSTYQLAEEYGCSQSTIAIRIRNNGFKIRSLSDAHVGRQLENKHPRYINLPIDEISTKYLNGMTTIELAKEYNCSTIPIANRLRNNGIKLRSNSEIKSMAIGKNNPHYIELPIDIICEKYLNGMTPNELGNEYGCSTIPIMDRLRNNGIKIRSNSEANKGKQISQMTRQRLSATLQGIPYDEWETFAQDKLYCPDFNEACRESNREKYGRMCFLTGLPESENVTSTGKKHKLSVHHYDMDKGQGCNDKKWKLIPVCLEWHNKVHNELWEVRIIWLLDNIWNNKNYKW